MIADPPLTPSTVAPFALLSFNIFTTVESEEDQLWFLPFLLFVVSSAVSPIFIVVLSAVILLPCACDSDPVTT